VRIEVHFVSIKIYHIGTGTIDAIIYQLQKRFKENKELAFKELLYASISHKDSPEFYKLKEIFLGFVEKIKELPVVTSIVD
jgi:hypothetical protein